MIEIRQIQLFRLSLCTRLPFRYGIAEMRELPHIIMRLHAHVDGNAVTGLAADHLPPHWFSKRPEQSQEEEIEELLGVIRHAANHAEGISASSAFDWWRNAYEEQMAWASPEGLPPLLAHFGVTLVERALIDAVCQAAGKPFHHVLLGGGLGFDPARVHEELAGFDWRRTFPETPRNRLNLRHTIGLGDSITGEDLPAGSRLKDGLPESLEEAIRMYGLSHFKIKLSGRMETDLDQLDKIHTCLRDEKVESFVYTLDGNEQFDSIHAFREAWAELSGCSLLQSPHGHLWCVEQPIRRDASLDTDPGWTTGLRGNPSMIIDESDGTIDSLPRALASGYAGTSHKNCKGVFKGLANGCLLAYRQGRHPQDSPPLILTGEDLCNIGPLALPQDLAVQATLNIPSVERNGHHYFRGLDAFPDTINQTMLALYPNLYHAHQGQFATLTVKQGQLDLEDILHQPFGSPEGLAVEEFAQEVPLR